jgi:hypothetical protein
VCEAAVLYPRWRDRVRAVLALRQKDDRWRERAEIWGDLAGLLKTLENGLLIPDLKLSFEPGPPNEGILRWQFRGPVRSSPSGRDGESPWRQSPETKWQALGNTLGEKFDAVILVEDLSGAGRRVAARVEKMPAAGEVKLTGLPDAGQLVIHLYGREAPHAAGETKPIGFTATPVLIDTATAAKSTMSPRGWRLLGEPASIGEVHSWHIRSSSGSLPPSLHLLLLDDNGQVCAAGTELNQSARHHVRPEGDAGGLVFRKAEMAAGLSFSTGREFTITAASAPKRLALALAPNALDEDAGPAARITVQELKEDATAPANPNRLEIERVWFATPGPGCTEPMLGGTPPFAAWLNGRRLVLVDVGKDSGPVVRELPVPENAMSRGMTWAGALLRFAFASPQGKPEEVPETIIIEINPADAAQQPKVIRLAGALEIAAGGYTAVPTAFTVLTEQGKFRGVITPEGKLLEPNADQMFGYWRPLSSGSIVCRPGPDGLFPVFDWTPGSLQLTFTKKTPPIDSSINSKPKWQLDGKGALLDTGAEPPRAFVPPLRMVNPVPLSDGRLAAISGSGVVRLRIVPAPPK